MKSVHVLLLEMPRDSAVELAALAGSSGVRSGWLEGLHPAVSDVTDASDIFVKTSQAGVLRSVLLDSGGSTLVLKKRRSVPPIRDLVREHFLGCRVVFVLLPDRAAVEFQWRSCDSVRLAKVRRLAAGDLEVFGYATEPTACDSVSNGANGASQAALRGARLQLTSQQLIDRLSRPRLLNEDQPESS